MTSTPLAKPVPVLQPKEPGRGRSLLDLGWLLGLVFRAAPVPSSFLTIIAVIQGLIVPLQLWVTKSLVDALAAQLQGGSAEGTFRWLALLVASLLFERTLTGVQPWMESSVRERTGSALQERVMRKASRLDLVSFEHQGYYDELNKVLSEVETRIPRILQTSQQLVRTVPRMVGYAVAIVYLSPLLLAIIVVPSVTSVIAWVMSGQINYGLVGRQTRDRRLATYYSDLLLDRRFAKEVRLYGLAGELLDRWSKLFWKNRIERRRLLLKMNLRLRSANGVSTAIIMGGLLWVVISGMLRTSAGGYALLFQSIEGLTSSLFGMGNVFQGVGEQSGYASAFRAFTRLPVERSGLISPANSAELSKDIEAIPYAAKGLPGQARRPAPTLPNSTLTASGNPVPQEARTFPSANNTTDNRRNWLQGGIRFEDVWFTYPGSGKPAIAGASFELAAGEKLALVGENGAGKTTLVKLLLGLYSPDLGRITIDGLDVREIEPEALYASMSAVLQTYVQYRLSFRENIGLSEPERMDDDGRLQQAVERAGLSDVLARLPQGYETLLGPDVGGVDLSGGQWQRVAIARGFFREAEVLALDEPTAALDPLAELAVFERFTEMVEGKTALLISHRLGMARLADRVMVMSRGKVVEQGTHDELLKVGGEYATLFSAQARWYE